MTRKLDVNQQFSAEQIIGFLNEVDAGKSQQEFCRKHRLSEGSNYLWRSKSGGMSVPQAKRGPGGAPRGAGKVLRDVAAQERTALQKCAGATCCHRENSGFCVGSGMCGARRGLGQGFYISD